MTVTQTQIGQWIGMILLYLYNPVRSYLLTAFLVANWNVLQWGFQERLVFIMFLFGLIIGGNLVKIEPK